MRYRKGTLMTDFVTQARDAWHGSIIVQRTLMLTAILAFTIVFCLIMTRIVQRQYGALSATLQQVVESHSLTR